MKTKICQNLKFRVSVNRSSSPDTDQTILVVLSMSENLCGRCMLLFPVLQWNLDTASLDTALILLLSQFLIMPDFFPSLSLLIKPQYSVIFTTSILLQHQFFCKPKTFFSYIFQPRYNINLKNGIFTID